jgi:single-strand DNA-binding protein
MNVIQFTGNVGKDSEIRDVRGQDVLNFNVAVQQGFGRDAPTEWYRCAIWGKQASAMRDHIVKGAKVAVVGRLKIGSYNDKPQFDVDVLDIDPWCGGKRSEEGVSRERQIESQSSRQTGSAASSFDDELDDNLPFLSCDPRREYKVS